VINYRNHDLYSYGGKSHINSAFPEANLDLDDSASKGNQYYQTVMGDKPDDPKYEKYYHEEVNDYQKNVS
jgi:hypothetical protein